MNERIKKELLKTEGTSSFPYLIHVHNDDLGDFYYCNYWKDITYEGKVYKASSFQIDPPEKTQSKIGNATFSFSIADQAWIEKIRSTQKRSTIEFVAVIVYENDTIEPIEDNIFTLTSARWNESTLTWDMIFDENMDILIPCDIMNGLNTPGCV